MWPPTVRRHKQESTEDLKVRDDLSQANSQAIRSVLDVDDDGHILKNRDLRDHLEHFNERMLDWEMTSKRKIFVQDYIGPPGGFSGVDSTDSMRSLDPTTMMFSFRGEVYNLQEMFDSILKIYNALGTIPPY